MSLEEMKDLVESQDIADKEELLELMIKYGCQSNTNPMPSDDALKDKR